MKYSEDKLKSRLRISNLKAYNEKLLQKYDDYLWVKFWTGKWDSKVIHEIGNNLTSVNILDVGCATGRLLVSLASVGAQKLAGTDIAPKIIELAGKNLMKKGLDADLKVSNAEDKLPWDNNTFNIVTMTGVLHHFFDPLRALSEVYRVLKQGGKLILIEPLFFIPLRQAVNLYLRFFTHEGDCRFYSLRQAEELLIKCSFSNVNGREVTFHSFIITGEKN
jgi:ubiquinone/menaquinone biosynthesis C-methylase UbiE